ncbi:hypothetical protein SAMN04488038_11925 [Solimonas aquatica]|uniref:MetA-pathway of phenol degradation n=1 Tax=Solimonas aquatica TaxID=489703 RepID=A0A1H9M6A4_9GAMM|nr:hypothetical protein [Solimonas aquatica]SER19214.1 hypothetical protein SAMN04488038_11925 [Solimonas aquatica]
MKAHFRVAAGLWLAQALPGTLAHAADAAPVVEAKCSQAAPKLPAAKAGGSVQTLPEGLVAELVTYFSVAGTYISKEADDAKTLACVREVNAFLLDLNTRKDLPDLQSPPALRLLYPAISSLSSALSEDAKKRAAATKGKDASDDTKQAAADSADAKRRLALMGEAAREALDNGAGHYAFYFGSNQQLLGNGDWVSGYAAMYRSESSLINIGDYGFFGWLPELRTFTTLEYFTRSSSAAQTDSSSSGSGSGSSGGNSDVVSPFDKKGGVANIQVGGNFMRPSDFFGLSFRLGYESLPVDGNKSMMATLRPNYSAGVVFRQPYLDSSVGQIFIGLARDKRWAKEDIGADETRNRYERIVLSGLLEMVKFGNGASVATRFYASMPAAGMSRSAQATDSELRLSILLGYDLNALRSLAVSP